MMFCREGCSDIEAVERRGSLAHSVAAERGLETEEREKEMF